MSDDDLLDQGVRELKASRPIGAILLALLFLLAGALLLFAAAVVFVRVFSADSKVMVHPALYVNHGRDVVTAGFSILAGVGLLAGRRWGWWIAVFHCFWRIECYSILPLAAAAAAARVTVHTIRGPGQLVGPVIIFGLVLLYLMRGRIMSAFGVSTTERLRACGITMGLSFPLAAAFELLLVIVSDPVVVDPLAL
jgi:hypothetical protein